MAETGATKVCVICKCDLAGVPRTRDKHGKYFCNPCYEKALKAKHERQARERNAQTAGGTHHSSHTDLDALLPDINGGTGEVLDDLVPQPLPRPMPRPKSADPRKCPACEGVLAVGAVMCTNCGYNLSSGVALKVNLPSSKVKVPRRTSTTLWACICAVLGALGLFGNIAVMSSSEILNSLPPDSRPTELSMILSIIGAMGLLSVGALMFLRMPYAYMAAVGTFVISLGNAGYSLLTNLVSPPEGSQSGYAAGLMAGQLIAAGVALVVIAIFYWLLLRHLRDPATRVEFGTK